MTANAHQTQTPEDAFNVALTAVMNLDENQLRKLSSLMASRLSQFKKMHAAKLGASLAPGDSVEFVSGRPKYLIGLRADVVKVNKSRVQVTICEDHKFMAKRFANCIVNVPLVCVKKVS